MSLKCSLLGHAYAEPDVEREREEQGSEVVITIRETEVCTRCGAERVVSENKEVTTLETPDFEDAAGADPADPPAEADTGAVEGSARSAHRDGATDAEVIDDEPAAEPTVPDAEDSHPADEVAQVSQDPTPADDSPATETPEAPTGTHADAADDDAVILDDDTEDQADDEADAAGSDDATESTTDAEPDTAADDGSSGGIETEGLAAWPEETEGDEPDWVRETAHTAPEMDPDSGSRLDHSSSAVTVPEGEFYCPDCDFTTSVEATSLRAGDFCPSCQTGTLAHRPESE
jgi:hypothetical protein